MLSYEPIITLAADYTNLSMADFCRLRTCVEKVTIAQLPSVEFPFYFFDVASNLDDGKGIIIKPGRYILLIEESFPFLKILDPNGGESRLKLVNMIKTAVEDDPTFLVNNHKHVLNAEPFKLCFPIHVRGTPSPVWCSNNTYLSLLHISGFPRVISRYKKRVNGFCGRAFPGIPAAVATAELIAAMNRIKAMPAGL